MRLGLIGAGKIAVESHLPAALAVPGVTVVAVVDPVLERAEQVVRDAGLSARAVTDLDPVIADLDAAVIATPNHTHADLACACFEAGVAVLLEKPLATTSAEGQRIAAAAARAGVTVSVGYCTRFLEPIAFLGELIDAGYFGSIERFAYQFGTIGGWDSASAFHLDRSQVGGGVLVTAGTHFLDRMLHWFARPESCELEDDSRGGPEANAFARFSWSSGLIGSARFSKTTALPPTFAMQTERGRVVLREGPGARIELFSSEPLDVCAALERTGEPGPADMYVAQLLDFVEAWRRGTPPAVDVQAGLACIEIVERLYAHRSQMDDDWYAEARR